MRLLDEERADERHDSQGTETAVAPQVGRRRDVERVGERAGAVRGELVARLLRRSGVVGREEPVHRVREEEAGGTGPDLEGHRARRARHALEAGRPDLVRSVRSHDLRLAHAVVLLRAPMRPNDLRLASAVLLRAAASLDGHRLASVVLRRATTRVGWALLRSPACLDGHRLADLLGRLPTLPTLPALLGRLAVTRAVTEPRLHLAALRRASLRRSALRHHVAGRSFAGLAALRSTRFRSYRGRAYVARHGGLPRAAMFRTTTTRLGRDPTRLASPVRTPASGDDAGPLGSRRRSALGSPLGLGRGLSLGGSALGGATGRLLLLGHCFFLASYDCANTFAVRDCAFDREPSRVELPQADVLVGDVHLAGLVTVPLGPLLRLLDGPTESAIEEQGLRLHAGFAPVLDEIRRSRIRRRRGRRRGAVTRDDRTDAYAVSRRTAAAVDCRALPSTLARSGELSETMVVQAHVFNVRERPNALSERQQAIFCARDPDSNPAQTSGRCRGSRSGITQAHDTSTKTNRIEDLLS